MTDSVAAPIAAIAKTMNPSSNPVCPSIPGTANANETDASEAEASRTSRPGDRRTSAADNTAAISAQPNKTKPAGDTSEATNATKERATARASQKQAAQIAAIRARSIAGSRGGSCLLVISSSSLAERYMLVVSIMICWSVDKSGAWL
jgi:hypothetical protein